MKNGYFQLVSDERGFGLLIKAPVGEGEKVRIAEVTDYLNKRNLGCDLSALKSAIMLNKDTVLHLGTMPCPQVNMTYNLSIDEDGMRAVARFYPPSSTGKKLSVSDFTADLAFRQIQHGICMENIENAFENEAYCTDIVVAEGTPARHGTDAVIEYYFNTDLKARPTLKDDGSVDFFNLNTVNSCHAGDLLAKLIPADPGDYGMSIQGAKIKPRDVKNAVLKYSHNIDINEEKTELTSKVDGHVTLVEDKVFVSNVLELENVDISTGNIEYEGSIKISGNVQSNFSVKARGNIIVDGLVEGAYLEAGGDIIVARGMAGMNKGELKADGNIVIKFLENAKVTAGGYITTEAILHSTVMAGDDITVDGKKGFITGGRICAPNQVKVKTLGSPMGTATIVEVGADPVVKEKLVNAQKEVAELTRVVKSVEPIINNYAHKRKQGIQLSAEELKYLTSLLKLREKKSEELEEATKETDLLMELIEQERQAQVVVKEEVYPGVRIVIGDVSMMVNSDMKYCKFVKQRGDVKMVGL